MKTQRTVTSWSCDQCGYVITESRDDSSVAEKHVMLIVRGKRYHFHGTNEYDGVHGPDVEVWDGAKSCLQRWMDAQRHLEHSRKTAGVQSK